MAFVRIFGCLCLGASFLFGINAKEISTHRCDDKNDKAVQCDEFEEFINKITIVKKELKQKTIVNDKNVELRVYDFFDSKNNLFSITFENKSNFSKHKNSNLSIGSFRVILFDGKNKYTVFSDVFEGYKIGKHCSTHDSDINIVKYGGDLENFDFYSKINIDASNNKLEIND